MCAFVCVCLLWGMSHKNESNLIRMGSVSYVYLCTCICVYMCASVWMCLLWVMSHKNKSFTYEWVMSHANGSCLICILMCLYLLTSVCIHARVSFACVCVFAFWNVCAYVDLNLNWLITFDKRGFDLSPLSFYKGIKSPYKRFLSFSRSFNVAEATKRRQTVRKSMYANTRKFSKHTCP